MLHYSEFPIMKMHVCRTNLFREFSDCGAGIDFLPQIGEEAGACRINKELVTRQAVLIARQVAIFSYICGSSSSIFTFTLLFLP